MRFIVDAQLPRILAFSLTERGFDAVHTLELKDGNRTPDSHIDIISMSEKRILITKDAHFVNWFLINGEPW